MKNHIIFDLDGTLVDSAADLAGAVNHTLKTIGRETFSEETIHHWVGNGVAVLVKRALSGSKEISDDINDNLFEEAREIFMDFYSKNLCVKGKLFEGVFETLTELSKNYTLTIVTNKPYDFVLPILETLKIDSLIKKYLGGDSLKKKKPDPMPLEFICKKLGFKVEESVMVGDSKNDILSAKSAGMDSIGVSYGYNYGEDISIYKPEFIIDRFSEILTIMKENSWEK
ncbi:MAG: phosphoglycolate phosphatase [Campylobacterales bacterium]|nr:phosphoglycolate phosphatase [Campylobacterales bacterium]